MVHGVLTAVAVVWAICAFAVAVIFAVSERAVRRASVSAPGLEEPIVAAQPRELAVSSAG